MFHHPVMTMELLLLLVMVSQIQRCDSYLPPNRQPPHSFTQRYHQYQHNNYPWYPRPPQEHSLGHAASATRFSRTRLFLANKRRPSSESYYYDDDPYDDDDNAYFYEDDEPQKPQSPKRQAKQGMEYAQVPTSATTPPVAANNEPFRRIDQPPKDPLVARIRQPKNGPNNYPQDDDYDGDMDEGYDDRYNNENDYEADYDDEEEEDEDAGNFWSNPVARFDPVSTTTTSSKRPTRRVPRPNDPAPRRARSAASQRPRPRTSASKNGRRRYVCPQKL